MSKTFNVNGICYPNEHYMVNIDSKLAQIKQLVDEKKIFCNKSGETIWKDNYIKYVSQISRR